MERLGLLLKGCIMRAYWPTLFLFVLSAAGLPARVEHLAPYDHCDHNGAELAAMPVSDGPVRLIGIDCPPGGNQSVSPDGQRFFSRRYPDGRAYQAPARLFVSGLEKGGPTVSYPFDPAFSLFRPLFHWASDFRSIWGADQKAGPGGFAIEPLKPVLLLPDGTSQALPLLVGPGGPLDGLLWIGGDGLALAEFGTRGSYYRPEHPDPEPTMAFVDAKHGRYLGWFSFKDFPKAVSAQGTPMVPLQIASAVLPDGRPRVVLQWPSGYSLVWTQGSEPREISVPRLPWGARMALAPDGRSLLIGYPLSATGAICEYSDDEPDPCPPPTPVTGKLVELVDIETGKTIWETRDTAKRFEGYREPVISPDGRYALIGVPQNDGHMRGHWLIYAKIGLISMSDGKIVQTVPSFSEGYSTSFGPNGRFFIGSVGYVATYEITGR
ncbi:MAG TPA: hypothetical protein VF079_00920 [Sphingomicrobium sp.]